MLWSNFDTYGYCVAVARSSDGTIYGEWIHEGKLLYNKKGREYDGGHGMIFTSFDGGMYLSIHSPNSVMGERKEKPVFYKIEEKDGELYLLG